MAIAGPAGEALRSLTEDQVKFIKTLPKAELHAHLNGSIPISVLQDLAREYVSSGAPPVSETGLSNEAIQAAMNRLLDGPTLDEISHFFTLFPAIYALTSTPEALARATRAVLSEFLDGEYPQCTYLELRSTPKETLTMSREKYVRVVLGELARYGVQRVGLVVSLDRRMGEDVLRECLDVAKKLKGEGEPVVGVDLCGDPMAGDMASFQKYFEEAKSAGLGVTLHIAETVNNPASETLQLLSFSPDRLGHATFLDDVAKKLVAEQNTCVEICLTSNLLCKTVPTLDDHHINHYLRENHPIAICTDDILPFRTSLVGEYALLMAQPPLGFGMSEDELIQVGTRDIVLIGPELPSHLHKQNKEEQEDDIDKITSIRPVIPSEPLNATKPADDEEDDEDDYVPALPPDMVAMRSAGPSNSVLPTSTQSSSNSSTSKRVVGPSLPSYPPTYDPMFHSSYAEDDDDDDDFGPKPLPAGVRHAETDAVKEFMEREERRRKEAEEAAKPKALKRDEWMLVPPTSSDLLGNLDPTKLKARQFSRSTAPAVKKQDNSLWTETPAERQQRLADEVSGKKRRAADPKVEEESDERKRRRMDEDVIRKGVDEYTQKRRGPALMAQHAASGKAEPSKDKEGGIWDHSRDMSLGGRLMDDEKRGKLVREAAGLGDRFGTAKSGGFL
ncbi:Adenosine deaminase-like protein [Hypsizygus marmoreus]|uniref:Adenosine deaminase-like protein n=1 Tax=Hypsizygus marmoreus TaxID=39966 RepID=A0A369K452_HYPMA|nr:Adenosine deaminase-like protein [Hypsizygus marmoreus]